MVIDQDGYAFRPGQEVTLGCIVRRKSLALAIGWHEVKSTDPSAEMAQRPGRRNGGAGKRHGAKGNVMVAIAVLLKPRGCLPGWRQIRQIPRTTKLVQRCEVFIETCTEFGVRRVGMQVVVCNGALGMSRKPRILEPCAH